MVMRKKTKIGLISLLIGIALTSGLVLFLFNKKPNKPSSVNMATMIKCNSKAADINQCVKVKADCCGCQEGGKNIPINRNYKSYWESKLRKKCKDVMCPMVISNDPSCSQKVSCIDNRCQLHGI